MATIPEQLNALAAFDSFIAGPTQKPIGVPWAAAYAAAKGKQTEAMGYSSEATGVEHAAASEAAVITGEKPWLIKAKLWRPEDYLSGVIGFWFCLSTKSKTGYRVVMTRQTAELWKIELQAWVGGVLEKTLKTVEGVPLANNWELALSVEHVTTEPLFKLWRGSEGAWEQMSENTDLLERFKLIQGTASGLRLGVHATSNTAIFNMPGWQSISHGLLEEEKPIAPVVTTGAASSITKTAATIAGTVNPESQATEYWVEYGTTEALGSKSAVGSLGAVKEEIPVTRSLSGLTEGTKYFYRMVAKNATGTTNGAIKNFTTLKKEAPKVETLAAQSVSFSGATLEGKVNPERDVTTFWFEWGLTEALGNKTPEEAAGEGEAYVNKAKAITGLEQGTKYYYRIVAKNSVATTQGAILSFKTIASKVAVKREFIPDRLSLRIVSPNGTPFRWAEDEALAENVLANIEIADEMPGGWKSFTGDLARDPRHSWHDLVAYSQIEVGQPGGERVFQGYLDETPDTSGEKIAINPAALGNQAILEDDNHLRVGFITGDLSKFTDPSAQRRKQLLEAAIQLVADITVGFRDAGELPAGIFMDFSNVEMDEAHTENGEQFFWGEGVDLGKIYYDLRQITTEAVNAAWECAVAFGTDDILTGSIVGTDHDNNTVLQQSKDTGGAAGYKYIRLRNRWTGAGAGAMTNVFGWTNLRVLGNHQLTPKGTWPEIGLSAQQMLIWLIEQHGSPLFANTESIEDDGYVIPEAWYGGAGNLAAIVKDIVKYALYDWFVYHGYKMEYRRPGSYGRFWKTWISECDLNETGVDSKRLWKAVSVAYQDVNGRTVIVGPIGSGADVEVEGLEITDPSHPAVLAKRARHDLLDMKGIGTPESAAAVGQRFLEEANLLGRSGSATLQGYCLDNKGVLRPVAQIKSGDWLAVVNASDTSYRKIVNKTYSHDNRSTQVDLDAPASGLEALLERLQVGLIEMGVN